MCPDSLLFQIRFIVSFKDNFDIFSKDIKLTLSGFKTLTELTHEFRASDFVFSDTFGVES